MKKSLNIQGRLLDLSKPVVKGILNCTPDSFYEPSRWGGEPERILAKAAEMIRDGAGILDVGGYSTRPGAAEVSAREEQERVVPVIRLLKKAFPDVCISIDTFRAGVAQAALSEGAGMINDVSGGDLDKNMHGLVAEARVPYVIMHMRGTPATMQNFAVYGSLVGEIIAELSLKVRKLLSLGVSDLIIDPGFGFSKSIDQNYSLLKSLNEFRIFDFPVLAGLSRKSMIYRFLDTDAASALNGTTALNMYSLINGASILRVHDVKEAKETIDLFSKLENSKI